MARAAQNMAKGTYDQAKGLYGTALGDAGTARGNASQIFGELQPMYFHEAMNPQGYGASDLGAMNTAAQQSTGGATASAVGENALKSMRTRNLGSTQVANNASAEEAGRTNSRNSLMIQGANADLKQRQASEGRAGLSGLEGQQLSTMLGALGIGNSALGTENSSTKNYIDGGNSGWFQNMLGLGNMLSGLGKSAAGLGVHV